MFGSVAMSKGVRKPIYLSAVRDKDILEYIETLTDTYSFSFIMRELIRDGIQYRKQLEKEKYAKVLQNHTPNENQSLEGLQLTDKKISDEDIEKRLDQF